MDLILEGIALRLEPDDVRHLVAAEGYLALGMYLEADAELDQIDLARAIQLNPRLRLVAIQGEPLSCSRLDR